jgi:tetratricopeptide (TPR) repeat protein
VESGVFVGRDREMAQLLAGLEDALAGRGHLFLLAGEPGIGKSRLADELAARAREHGARVLWGRCWEAGGAPAYWPWVQSLRAYVRHASTDVLRAQLGPGAGDVAQLVPEIHETLPDVPDAATADPEAARFRLFDSTVTFLRNISSDLPLVLVLEDLHAADASSLLLLEFVARSLADMRALVMATYRDVEVGRDHPLLATLVEVARETPTRRVLLTGLTSSDVGRFIETTSGIAPSEALVESVLRETEGNPLFVGEIVRLLASEGRLSDDARGSIKPIPQGIRDVIGRRLGHLSERCYHVLGVASVLGREFTLDVLGEISERPPEELLEILDEATAARLVAETPGVLGGLRFSHSLIRDTLYEELSGARRMRLHRHAGEALEKLRGPSLEHLAELAHHFFVAAPMGEGQRAGEYARRAAAAAQTGLAFEEAARLYRMALQAMQFHETQDEGTRYDILVALGEALNRAGDAEGARREFLEAAAIARHRDDPEGLARAALGYGGRFSWTVLRGDPYLVPLLEEALAALADARTPLKVMVLGRLAAGPLRDAPDPSRRHALSQEAVELAQALGDSATIAYALDAQLGAIMSPAARDEMMAQVEQIERLGLRLGDAEKVLMAHVWRLYVRLLEGNMREVALERREIARLADQLRQGPQNWFMLCTEASLALFAGRFDEAERLGAAAYEAGRRAEPYALFAHRVQMLWMRMEQGRSGEMQDEFQDSVARFSVYPVWRAVLPYLLLSLGRRDESRAAMEEVLAGTRPMNEEWLLGEGVLADAAASLEDREAAPSLYDELLPYAELTMGGFPDINVGSLHRPLGRLAALLGRLDDAERHLRRAVEANERMGARPWAAHARTELASMLLARDAPGDRESAEELLGEAAVTARELGMRTLEEKTLALLGNRVAETTSVQAPAARPAVFRREGEYYSISYEGVSFRLHDSKGLRHLALLLASPGREHHVMELVAAVEAVTEMRRPADRGMGHARGDAGEVLDAEALSAYKRRLGDLEEEIAEAEGMGDAERAARAREEQEFLVRELASAVGLGGRARQEASASERARVNVTRAIKAALARVAEHSTTLGRHLEATVRTGTFCSYTPDPRHPFTWRL